MFEPKVVRKISSTELIKLYGIVCTVKHSEKSHALKAKKLANLTNKYK